MALSEKNRRREFARAIATVQKSVSDLGKYLETSIPFMAEVVANGDKTGVQYAKVWTDFLNEIKTVQDIVKADEENVYTVARNFNTINDYVAERFIGNIEAIAGRADSRIAANGSVRNKQVAGATLSGETRKALLAKDGGMFNAIIWYVEGIGLAQFEDGAAFTAPFTALVTAIDTFLADWVDTYPVKVSDKNIETITPYTLDVLNGYLPLLAARVDHALEFAGETVAPTPTYYKITCTGAGTGTCDIDTVGTDFADDPTCGGTDYASCTVPAPTPTRSERREAELAEAQKVLAEAKLKEEAKQVEETVQQAEVKEQTFGLN